MISLGFYFLGDYACALRPFWLTPYDNVKHGTPEDALNYHLSTNRIYVECAFGEIDSRWGIFWSPLRFDLNQNLLVIDAALRLHNFIVQNDLNSGTRHTLSSTMEFDDEVLAFMAANPNEIVGVFGEEVSAESTGRGGS